MENEIRYADLFGGVGGFRLGIERAYNSQSLPSVKQDKERRDRSTAEQGALLCSGSIPTPTCVFYSDIDKYSVQTYNKNFNENHKPTDITKIPTDDIPEIDMLCGGFPCQAFSIAGKRRGFEDTRGTLFFEVARIIKAKRPKIVWLENVKGLLNHNQGQTFRTIIQTLSELGYDVQWMVLNSKFFGVPQNRERVFIIGSLRGSSRPEILPFREASGEFNERNTKEQTASSLQHPGHSGGNYKGMNMININKTVRTGGRGSLTKKHAWDIVEDNSNIRRLTPTECERLQGFPDGWTAGVSDTQRYKQMENAVTVNVIEAIARRLYDT